MSDEPVPTFQTNRDRITYLLAEYRIPLSVMLLAAGVWAIWATPQLPTVPDSWLAFATSWGVLALPSYIISLKIANWLHTRDWVEVHHINGVEDIRKPYSVPPEIWEDKHVDGADPYPVNGGTAYEVREYEYDAELGQLTVEGTWMEATLDSNLVTSKAMMQDVHGILLEGYMELSKLRARISRMGVDIQEAVINEHAEAVERGVMIDREATREAFEDAQRDAEADEVDIPEIGDYQDDDLAEPFEQPTQPQPQEAATDGGTNDRS